jgi:glycerol-3-phosphate dehydrogenase (NAD(P)+)
VQIANRYAIELPIATMVDRLLRGDITPEAALTALMQRDRRSE